MCVKGTLMCYCCCGAACTTLGGLFQSRVPKLHLVTVFLVIFPFAFDLTSQVLGHFVQGSV